MKLTKTLGIVGLVTAFAAPSFGAEDPAVILKDAKAQWEKRQSIDPTNLAEEEKIVQELVTLLEKKESDFKDANSTTPEIRAEIYYYFTRAYYNMGDRLDPKANKDEKLAVLQKAMDKGTMSYQAMKSADSTFFYAAALGLWAKTKGINESLGRKDELLGKLQETKTLPSITEKSPDNKVADGLEFQGFGADRVLGKVYDKLPKLFGGGRDKALSHLRMAYKSAPHFAFNAVSLAEVLVVGSAKAEKDEGCQVLNELLSKDKKTIDPSRVFETHQEFDQAAKLKASNCK